MHLLTQSALLKALGGGLLNSLWQMALLWLLYTIFISVFRTASAHTRHGLAFLFLITGMMWTTTTFFINYFFAGPLSGAGIWEDVSGVGVYSFLLTGRQLINAALPYCSFGYLLTLAFLFIRYANQYFHSRQLKERGLSKIEPGLRVFVEETSRRMGIRKKVQVWLSSLVEGPVTLGFVKPVILIPVAMVNNLSLQQVEAILLHELAHIKRYDYLLHLGVTIIEMLFFFNPFVRWLIRDIKKEREHRCDDVVMQFRYDPHTYVSALLSLATNNLDRQQQLALAAAGGSDQLLLQRVRRILRIREVKDRPGATALIFLLFTLAGAIMLFSGGHFPKENIAAVSRAGITIGPIIGTTGRSPGSSMDAGMMTEGPMTETAAPTMTRTELLAINIKVTAPKAVLPSSALHKKYRSASSDAPDIDHDPDEASEAENDGMIAAENESRENQLLNGEFATIVQPDDREYSIGPAVRITMATSAKKAITFRQPFVPNSSFSFQQIEDTAKLLEKYAYLQSLAAHELTVAIKKMQKELQVQLQVLQATRTKEDQSAIKVQKQLLEEQLKLQGQFLQKQQELERKLERAGKIRRIVFI